MEELLEKVMSWIENLFTGSLVYGYQRLGKTMSLKYIVEEIRDLYGQNIMVGIAPMVTNVRISESAFWGQILKAFNHSLWSNGNAQIKRDRLFKYLNIFNQNVKGRGRAILFIDDAQKLEHSHYNWLSEIHNDLALNKLHLMVILVGQPELLISKGTLEENHKYEIISRFMNTEHQFHGIRNVDDVAIILNSYDESTEYPHFSRCSFVNYHFTEAFRFGWRLEQESEKIWNELQKLRTMNGVSEDLLIGEVHMEYFARIIEYLCLQYKTDDPGFVGFTVEQIKSAIENSGYIGASKYLRYKDILPKPSTII